MSSTVLRAPAPARADETIVVVGDAPSEDEAASTSVITAERTPRSVETVPDLLGDLPGVTVSRLGGVGAPALLSLRGSSWEQVSVYLDGVNLNLAAGGGVDVSSLPIGDLARIEIFRGVTPIAYGGSAIGGVLAMETRRPQQDEATLEVGVGSFGTWTAGGSVSLGDRRHGLYIGAHALKTSGDFKFVDTKGTAFDPDDDETVARGNNRVHERDGVVRGFIALPDRRELSLLVLGFDREQGLPGYPRYKTTRSSLRTRRGIASAAYESHDDRGRLRAQLYGYGLDQHFIDPLSEIAITPTDARDRTFALGGTVRVRRVVTPWLQPAALLDVRHESSRPVDLTTGEQGATSTRQTAVAGAEFAFRLASVSVIPSLRIEQSRDVTNGRDGNGTFADEAKAVNRTLPIVRLGATKALRDNLMLRGNVGRYVRLPSFLELYGNSGFILGNRELTPERGLSGDLGVAVEGPHRGLAATADVAAFATLVTDLIQFQQNANGVARARNIGKARVLGIESSGEVRYGAARLYAQATLTDARDRSESAAAANHQLPYRPQVHATVRPELRRYPVPGAELGVYVELDLTSGNYVDPANLVRLPSRALWNAGASISFSHVRLIASFTNLTSSSVTDVLANPLPGRACFFTVALAATSHVKEP